MDQNSSQPAPPNPYGDNKTFGAPGFMPMHPPRQFRGGPRYTRSPHGGFPHRTFVPQQFSPAYSPRRPPFYRDAPPGPRWESGPGGYNARYRPYHPSQNKYQDRQGSTPYHNKQKRHTEDQNVDVSEYYSKEMVVDPWKGLSPVPVTEHWPHPNTS